MTTEWDEIQMRLGNIPKRDIPRGPTAKEYDEQALENREEIERDKERKLESASLEQLNELEDEEEDKILESYRRKRMEELRQQALRNRYGELIPIAEPDYKYEVTEAPHDVYVVVFLTKPGIPTCKRMEQLLIGLANKFKATKFVKIRSEEAIRNYPDRNLPTLLIYKKGDVVKQFVTLSAFHGESTTLEDVEWALAQVGAVDSELEENPRYARGKVNFGNRLDGLRGREDSDSDSDD